MDNFLDIISSNIYNIIMSKYTNFIKIYSLPKPPVYTCLLEIIFYFFVYKNIFTQYMDVSHIT